MCFDNRVSGMFVLLAVGVALLNDERALCSEGCVGALAFGALVFMCWGGRPPTCLRG